MSQRLRLFVALDVPATVRAELAAWCARVAPPGVRPVPADNLHLTLAFLGSRPPGEARAVAPLLTPVAATHALPALATCGALWLPPRRPGVLTVGLVAVDELMTLRAAVVAALAATIGFEAESRPYRPHVTVGRVARAMRVSAIELDPPPPLTFAARALTLYRSHTGAGGTRYEPLARAAM